jgi:hypothetical protein
MQLSMQVLTRTPPHSRQVSVLLPFDMSPEEQQALPRPWTRPEWGSTPSCEVDDSNLKL